MTDPIHWTQDRKRLGDLSPWPRNPRQIKLPQAKRLAESFTEFGQVETLAVSPDGDIYNGHQRLNVLLERYGPDYEVDVRVSSRPLSEKEREKLTVYLHRGATGSWDFDLLADGFEADELIEWGFTEYDLGIANADDPNELWQGMPKFENEARPPLHSIKVHFQTVEALSDFAALVGQTITDKSTYIWYPYRARDSLKSYIAHEP